MITKFISCKHGKNPATQSVLPGSFYVCKGYEKAIERKFVCGL